MAVLAGQTIIAGRVPGERIATTIATADTSTFTSETVIDSVTAPLVVDRVYRVRWIANLQSSVAADTVNVRIREDSISGTVVTDRRAYSPITTAGAGFAGDIEAEYTAVATGDKTFVSTADRSTGTGNITAEGAATRPRYLYVEYVRG